MGTVYLAAIDGDVRREALRVVKRLRPDLASDAEFVQMFLEEARLASLLDHPNVVRTGKVGFDGRHYFFEMEYLEGQSLYAIARRAANAVRARGSAAAPREAPGGVPLRLSLWILAEVLAGLAHAHDLVGPDGRRLSIVHRDVSPHNVMVTYAGEVKLLDFGIAKAVDSSLQTRSGVVKGKLTYMAPEQALRRRIDHRADLFAVGVMLWEAVAGERLNDGLTETEAFERLATLAIPPPRTRNPDAPEALDAICLRAVAAKPEDRFASATEMRDALVAVAGGPPDAAALGAFVAEQFADARARLDEEIAALLAASPDAPVADVDVPLRPPVESNATTAAARREEPTVDLQPGSAPLAPPGRPSRGFAVGVIAAALLAGAGAFAYARAHRAPPPGPAERAYAEGMTAFRDADGTDAVRAFERAEKLDPDFAPAHLRRAIARFGLEDEERAAMREAIRTRASLGEHDRALLEAMTPLATTPGDFVEAERRLDTAIARAADDADFALQLCRVQQFLGEYAKARDTCARAATLDPGAAAPIRARSLALMRLDDVPGALAGLDACLRASPLATSCFALKKQLEAFEGRCDDALATVRRVISLQRATEEDYADLASFLFAKGEPIESVRGALEQRYAALPEGDRDVQRHHDAATLAMLRGDFDGADAELRVVEAAAAKSHDEDDHVLVAMYRARLAEETGRVADARRVAEAYLNERASWSPSQGDDYSMVFVGVLRRIGAIGRDEFVAKRDAWLARKKAQPAGGSFGWTMGRAWIRAYAAAALTAADAREALDALPAFEPLPDSGQRSPDFDGPIGHAYLLADRPREALAYFERAARSCAPLIAPIEQTIAMYELGVAREKLGDARGACDAYREVEKRWGASARSVTAAKAKAARGALGCADP
jgi:serine/threonine-protein kinase